MLKPDSPFQASAVMSDSLEFIKKFWGGMGIPGTMPSGMSGIPGMSIPTFSVEELRKKITELRTVESWLELNTNMLRATIQALEVQAATLANFQSMGETFQAAAAAAVAPMTADKEVSQTWPPTSEHVHPSAVPDEKDEADAAAFTAPLVNAASWWGQLQDQFQQAVTHAMNDLPKANGHDHGSSKERQSKSVKKPVAKKATAKKTAAKKSTARKRTPAR